MHNISQGITTGVIGGDIGKGFVSAMKSSAVSSVVQMGGSSFMGNGDMATMFFGTVSGGLSAELAGGNFWQGAATGLTVSALNHMGHRMMKPKTTFQGDPEWDLNGDGILQKDEADLHGVKGGGKAITVDNKNIDWTGLEIPEGKGIGDRFSIETHQAFLKLPWETAATYGGTSFEVTGSNTVKVLDQKYHYEMRPNNSAKNIIRNIATKVGHPTTMELYNDKFQPYMIHYKNPTIKLK